MEHMDATIDEDYEIDAAAQARIEMLRADYYHQDREDDRFIASMKAESDAMESDERDRLWWLAYGGEDTIRPGGLGLVLGHPSDGNGAVRALLFCLALPNNTL